MPSSATYKIDGKYLTLPEAVDYVAQRAKEFDPETRKMYLETFSSLFNYDMTAANNHRRFHTYIVPFIGLVLLISMLIFSWYNPIPSKYQSGIYWIAFSMAVAACAVALTGFLEVNIHKGIKATGAIAIFCIMYFYVPAIMGENLNEGGSKLNLYIAKYDTSGLQELDVVFQANSGTNICDFSKKAVEDYYGSSLTDSFTFYRASDGKIYVNESCRDIKEHDILAISNSLLPHFQSKREAYAHFLKFIP